MKKAAIITAGGFGDGLIMLVAASYLEKAGYDVTVFNNHLSSFAKWFPSLHFENYPSDEKTYLDYFCILQNDNSQRSKAIIDLRKDLNLSVFYPSYSLEKHGALFQNDFVFDQNISMVKNVAQSCSKLLKQKLSYDTSIKIPTDLSYRKYPKKIIIHATSGDPNRNWPLSKYVNLAIKIKKEGLFPTFISTAKESDYFKDLKMEGFEHVKFDSLSDLAALIYESSFFIGNESGPSHLASLLNVPLIVISNNQKRMRLWQPGWQKADVIAPYSIIPNFKSFRLREKHWGAFIPVFKVFRTFEKCFSDI